MAWGTPLVGANESINIVREATFNTKPTVTPLSHALPLISSGFGLSRDKGASRILLGTPNPSVFPRGVQKAAGPVVVPIGINSFGVVSYFMLTEYGTIVAGSTGTYASHNDGTDVITLSAPHGWAANTKVILRGGTFGGLTQNAIYYVISPSGADLKVSLTSGGVAIDLTSAAATGTPIFHAEPFTHSYKIGTTAKRSFVSELWNAKGGAGGTGAGDVFMGCMFASLDLGLKPAAEELVANLQIMGTGKNELQNAAVIATPTSYASDEFCLASMHQVKIDGAAVAYVIDGSLKIEQEIEVVKVVDGTLFSAYCIPKRYRVSGGLICLMDNNVTARTLATGLAEHALQIICPAPVTAAHNVTIDVKELMCETTNAPALNDTGHREISLEWDGYYANDAGLSAVTISVTNAIPDYSTLI